MAGPADTVSDANAEAAAEKAYADAAGEVSPKAALKSATALDTPKIDKALAAAKAAPKKKAPLRKAAKQDGRKAIAAKKTAREAAPKNNTRSVSIAPRTGAVAKLKDKMMAATKTTTTDFTETFKTATAEAQSNAKAAYEKLQSYAGEMTEFTKGNVEAVVESGKILGSGMQDIARGEVEAAKGAFETITADLKAMAAVKSPAELFKLQGEIARRNFDAAVARYSKNAEVSMKLANEAFAPLSNRMSLAVEKVSNRAA